MCLSISWGRFIPGGSSEVTFFPLTIGVFFAWVSFFSRGHVFSPGATFRERNRRLCPNTFPSTGYNFFCPPWGVPMGVQVGVFLSWEGSDAMSPQVDPEPFYPVSILRGVMDADVPARAGAVRFVPPAVTPTVLLVPQVANGLTEESVTCTDA